MERTLKKLVVKFFRPLNGTPMVDELFNWYMYYVMCKQWTSTIKHSWKFYERVHIYFKQDETLPN